MRCTSAFLTLALALGNDWEHHNHRLRGTSLPGLRFLSQRLPPLGCKRRHPLPYLGLGSAHYNYVEFKVQTPERQKEYWNWRHDHN